MENVPDSIDLSLVTLIFENYRYCGHSEVISTDELIGQNKDGNEERRIILEFSNDTGIFLFNKNHSILTIFFYVITHYITITSQYYTRIISKST